MKNSDYLNKVVKVTWLDAWWDTDNITSGEFKESFENQTYGLCLRYGDIVSIAHELLTDNEYKGVTHIPISLVKSIEVYNLS